jgi:hypothetical protein
MRTSMRRHCLSRPTWRPLHARARQSSVSFAMLPFAISVSPLFSDSVHYGILLFGLIEDAAIFGSVSPLRGGWTKFATCAVALSLDPKRSDTKEKPYGSV